MKTHMIVIRHQQAEGGSSICSFSDSDQVPYVRIMLRRVEVQGEYCTRDKNQSEKDKYPQQEEQGQ